MSVLYGLLFSETMDLFVFFPMLVFILVCLGAVLMFLIHNDVRDAFRGDKRRRLSKIEAVNEKELETIVGPIVSQWSISRMNSDPRLTRDSGDSFFVENTTLTTPRGGPSLDGAASSYTDGGEQAADDDTVPGANLPKGMPPLTPTSASRPSFVRGTSLDMDQEQQEATL